MSKKVQAELSESLYEGLLELAKKRGVSANTVLQQAIASEIFLDEQESRGSDILIHGDTGFSKVRRSTSPKR